MGKIPDELRRMAAAHSANERATAAIRLSEYRSLESVELLKSMLSNESSEVVYSATRSLVMMGGDDVLDALIPLLRADDARLRNLTIEILGRMGSPATQRVAELVADRDKDVRRFAVEILGAIGTDEVIDPLIACLSDENVNVAAEAAETLGDLRSERAVAELIRCLNGDPWLRCAAIRSLGKIGGDDALNAILSLEVSDEMTLFCIVTALGSIGSPKSIDFLAGVLNGDYHALRLPTIQALSGILANADQEEIKRAQEMIDPGVIISALNETRINVLKDVVQLLGILSVKEAAFPIANLYQTGNESLFPDIEHALLRIRPPDLMPFVRLMTDENPETVRIAVARLLGKLGGDAALKVLSDAFMTTKHDLKREIALALGDLRDERALPMLHNALKDANDELAITLIDAIATSRSNSSVAELLALCESPSVEVRDRAAKALARYKWREKTSTAVEMLSSNEEPRILFGLMMMGDQPLPELRELILRLTEHDNESIRRSAVEKAMLFGEFMLDFLTDESHQVRLSAIRYLQSHPKSEFSDALMEVVRNDDDDWNRYEAVHALGKLGRKDILSDLIDQMPNLPNLVKTAVLDIIGDLLAAEYLMIVRDCLGSSDEILRDAAKDTLLKFDEAKDDSDRV